MEGCWAASPVNRLVGVDERAQSLLLRRLPFVAAGGWLVLAVFVRFSAVAFTRAVLRVTARSGAVPWLR